MVVTGYGSISSLGRHCQKREGLAKPGPLQGQGAEHVNLFWRPKKVYPAEVGALARKLFKTSA